MSYVLTSLLFSPLRPLLPRAAVAEVAGCRLSWCCVVLRHISMVWSFYFMSRYQNALVKCAKRLMTNSYLDTLLLEYRRLCPQVDDMLIETKVFRRGSARAEWSAGCDCQRLLPPRGLRAILSARGTHCHLRSTKASTLEM